MPPGRVRGLRERSIGDVARRPPERRKEAGGIPEHEVAPILVRLDAPGGRDTPRRRQHTGGRDHCVLNQNPLLEAIRVRVFDSLIRDDSKLHIGLRTGFRTRDGTVNRRGDQVLAVFRMHARKDALSDCQPRRVGVSLTHAPLLFTSPGITVWRVTRRAVPDFRTFWSENDIKPGDIAHYG